ncbi:MAG: AMP-binding protein, partial [Myxococcales bacterium]|nr:AMP-binding protein [Myxococcales bacterium]
WFEIAAEEGSTLLTTTNFANHFFNSRCNALLKKPDLSKVKAIVNGAEPIVYSVTQTSKDLLASWELKPDALTSAYGLAEATLTVTIKDQIDECNFLQIDSRSIGMGEKVTIISQVDAANKPSLTPHSIIVANVGKPIPSLCLEIVDDFQIPLNELEIGNIFIQGPTVTRKIINHQGLNNLDEGYVTGDIGFIFNGCLYWLGRTKDHFKVNGLSYFANEIESHLFEALGISPGQCVVSKNDFSNDDEIIVFLRAPCVKTYESLAQSIFETCRKQFGFEITRFIKIAKVPRTTSGKIQRFQLMRDFLNQDESSKENFSNPLVLNKKSTLAITSSTIVNQLLQTYLGNDVLSDKDMNIQDLELSSLDLLILVNELSKKLSISVSVADIYSHPNITDFRNFLISSYQQSLNGAKV